MKRNVAGQTIDGQMFLLADGLPFTGVASVSVKKDGGALVAGLGVTPVHAGQGNHGYSPTPAETDGDRLSFVFSGTGAATITVQTYTTFPQTVDNDALASGASGFVSIKTQTAAIDIKTTNLPTDPADESLIIAATDALNVGIVGIQADLNNATDGLGAIKTGVNAIDTAPMRGTDGANTVTPPTVLAIADAVHDEPLVGHVVVGTAGKKLADIPTTPMRGTDGVDISPMRGTDGANIATPPTAIAIRQEMDASSVKLASVLVDTGTDIPALINALQDISTAQVKAQIDAAIKTDPAAELIAVPAANASLLDKVTWMAMQTRDEVSQTVTQHQVKNNLGIVVGTAPVSKLAGVFTRGKYI